jgi:hypothetical protein
LLAARVRAVCKLSVQALAVVVAVVAVAVAVTAIFLLAPITTPV